MAVSKNMQSHKEHGQKFLILYFLLIHNLDDLILKLPLSNIMQENAY
jgi:hypothetical protein